MKGITGAVIWLKVYRYTCRVPLGIPTSLNLREKSGFNMVMTYAYQNALICAQEQALPGLRGLESRVGVGFDFRR